MAENTGEEQLAAPANTPPGSPPEEIAPAEDTEPIAQNQETENMEVHHHAHHGGKKNWKSYLWEFLMLFLAVFCGFLAENQREHYVEKVRAKEYARSFVNDLKNDTVMVNRIIAEMQRSYRRTDSLLVYLKNKSVDQIRNFDLYVLNNTDDIYRPYSWNRATLEQIKSSGSLRYFSNDSIISQVTSYDAFTHHMDDDLASDEEKSARAVERRNQIIDMNYPSDFTSAYFSNKDSLMKTALFEEMITKGPVLLTTDMADIKKFINEKLSLRRILENRAEGELPRLKKQAKELIELLKKKYHLD